MTVAKTEKLYLENAYTTSFNAKVISTEPSKDGSFVDVVLNQSYFYPESGGQLSDRGRLAGASIIDVLESSDHVVTHRVQGDAGINGVVECEVNWDTRFDHMQQHTGQHVLSRAFIQVADLHTVSFHMGDDTCTIDVEGARFDDDAVRRAEQMANQIIEENRTVTVTTMAPDAIEDKAMRRKLPAGVTEARIVEVQDFDTIPCCGTHVRATGELRLLKVIKWENVKKRQRIHFKVGRRAIADYQAKHGIVQQLSTRLTTSPGDISLKLDKLMEEGQSARKRINAMGQKMALLDAERLRASSDATQPVVVAQLLEDADSDYLKLLSRQLAAIDGTVAVLASSDGAIICAASDGVEIDFSQLLTPTVRDAGGKGGGKGVFAQFKMPTETNMSEIISKVEANVRKSFS